MPAAKSSSRFPSTSVTQTPLALAATIGALFVEVIRTLWSRSMIRRASGPGMLVRKWTPRTGTAGLGVGTGAAAEAASLMENPSGTAARAKMLAGGAGRFGT